jgi:hypothetical protein
MAEQHIPALTVPWQEHSDDMDRQQERERQRANAVRTAVRIADEVIVTHAEGSPVELAWLTAALAEEWAKKSLLMQQARLLRMEAARTALAAERERPPIRPPRDSAAKSPPPPPPPPADSNPSYGAFLAEYGIVGETWLWRQLCRFARWLFTQAPLPGEKTDLGQRGLNPPPAPEGRQPPPPPPPLSSRRGGQRSGGGRRSDNR